MSGHHKYCSLEMAITERRKGACHLFHLVSDTSASDERARMVLFLYVDGMGANNYHRDCWQIYHGLPMLMFAPDCCVRNPAKIFYLEATQHKLAGGAA